MCHFLCRVSTSLDSDYATKDHARDPEAVATERLSYRWHPGLPQPPDGFPRSASFQLMPGEACYLHDRILSAAPCSLLAALVSRDDGADEVPFVWFHPALAFRFLRDIQAGRKGEREDA